MGDEVVGQLVRGLIELAISEDALGALRRLAFGFDDAFSVWEASSVRRKNLVNCCAKLGAC